MPAVLDTPKNVNKQEEFVQKQIEEARQRIRRQDALVAVLILAIGTLVFLLSALLIDRYVETPRAARWGALAVYLAGAAGLLYLLLFRPSRRQINPFYAARKVEQTIPDAKNSVVNYIDLKDDDQVPGSVKAAIGIRAARDLKQVDVAQVLRRRRIAWLASAAGVLLAACSLVAFLPPTRTTLNLLTPAEGNATILQGQDFQIEIELTGRVPDKTDPDAARCRLWYNPDDPTSFEDRPLEPKEGKRGQFSLTIPARQTRTGFRYQLRAGNAVSPEYDVNVQIIPQFQSWTIDYEYPAYLGREPAKSDNANLVGYFGTVVTITAFTNRPVKSGSLEIKGQLESIPGQTLPDNPEAIRYRLTLQRPGQYVMRFTTTDGRSNLSPQSYTIALLDPTPMFLRYDVTYDYPRYLRAQKATIDVREPHLEAARGTRVTLVAHANRPIKEARVQFPGVDQPIVGQLDPANPTRATFNLPPLMADGDYRVVFTPNTREPESKGEVYQIRVLPDDKPRVELTKPEQDSEVPANGILPIEGLATDDYGIDRLNLRLEVVSPAPRVPLALKPYRDGVSFKREADQSYPTRVDYKDVIDLAKLKPEGAAGAGFAVKEGMVIEYWLEAIDNCDVPPGPNSGFSEKRRIKVLAPVTAPEKMQQQQAERQQADKDQQAHEQKQDRQNAAEKRDPKQPQPQGDGQPMPPMGDPQPGEEQPDKKNGSARPQPNGAKKNGQPDDANPAPPMDDERLDQEFAKLDEAVKNANRKDQPAGMNDPKSKPMPDEPKDNPNTEEKPQPTATAKDPMGGGNGMGDMNQPNPEQLPNPEDFQKLADKLKNGDERQKKEAREQLKQMMDQARKNPPQPDEQKNKLDEHRKNLDQERKEKFDQAKQEIQKEMQKLEREERVRDAADRAMSDDPKKREQGQKDLERELQNQRNRDDVERQLQQLANDQADPERKKKLEDAHNLSRNNAQKKDQAGKNDQPPMPKKNEGDVDRLAKKMEQKESDPGRQAAEKELEERLRDPARRDQVQKQLDDIRENLKDEQAKKNFDDSMRKIKENVAKNDAPKEPPAPKPEEIQKMAQKLTSDDKAERDEAKKQLEEAMKQADQDPKARDQARDQLKQTRDQIKDDKKKEQFDKAVDDINKAVNEQRQERQAKADQQRQNDAKQMANDLAGKDDQKRQAAQDKLEKMRQDPATKDQVKKDLDQAAKSDPAKQDAVNDAMKKADQNLAKKDADAKATKEEIQQAANDLRSKDADKRQAAQDKLEKMANDPATRDQVKKELDQFKKDHPESKDAIDQAMKKADENGGTSSSTAKKNGPSAEDIAKLAKALQSDDPATREQIKKQLEKELNQRDDDPKSREEAAKQLQKARDAIADPKKREEFDKNLQDIAKSVDQTRQQVAKERTGQAAKDLQSKDPGKQQAAQEKLEQMLQDPAKRETVKEEMNRLKKEVRDEAAKKNLDDAMKKAGDNVAKKEAESKVDPKETEQLVRDMLGKDPQKAAEAKKKLDELQNDPKKKDDLDRQLAEMMKDPAQRQEFQKAAERAAKDQLAKLADQLSKADPAQKRQIKEQIEKLLQNKDARELAQRLADDLAKEKKDDPGAQELADEIKKAAEKLAKKEADSEKPSEPGKDVDLTKAEFKKSGDVPTKEAKPTAIDDLREKLRAGELTLRQFKDVVDKEKLREEIGLTPEQFAELQPKFERRLDQLRKQLDLAEKGELPLPRLAGPSALDRGGPERIYLVSKDNGPVNTGGKLIAPPGFGDPYGRFTEEVSGRRQPVPNSPKK
jgi:hypothetical protein